MLNRHERTGKGTVRGEDAGYLLANTLYRQRGSSRPGSRAFQQAEREADKGRVERSRAMTILYALTCARIGCRAV